MSEGRQRAPRPFLRDHHAGQIQPLASRSSGSRRRKVRRACAASRCTPAGLTCRAAVTCVKQDHPPRGTRLRVPFFHARPYKRALGSWGGCKRFRLAVVCAVFARPALKMRSVQSPACTPAASRGIYMPSLAVLPASNPSQARQSSPHSWSIGAFGAPKGIF